MTGTTRRGQAISLGEFLGDEGGVLLARCDGPECRTVSVVPAGAVDRRSSLPRLEDAVRCACGRRGGSLSVWRGTAPPPVTNQHCYLFHG